MRVHASTVVSLLLLAAFGAIQGDTGAGSGRPMTPYAAGDPTVGEVDQIRELTAKSREIHGAELAGGRSVSGANIALMYVQDEPSSEPFWSFSGKNESGVGVSVSFTEIARLSLVETSGGIFSTPAALFEIEVFPAISAKQLMDTKPTYTQLLEFSRHTLRVKVPLRASGKGDLCLVARNDSDEKYRILAKLRDLKPKSEIRLEYGAVEVGGRLKPAIWWATPSVTADKNYPYRYRTKR